MKTTDQIIEILENLCDSELVNVWNYYTTEVVNNSDATVYVFDDEFFEIYFSNPAEAARAVFFGDVKSWADSYVIFNGYGNLETSNYVTDLISITDLANDIEANPDMYTTIIDLED